MNCNYCKSNIIDAPISFKPESVNKLRVFCSDICFSKYKSKYGIGQKHSIETRQKIAASNSKPHSESRKLAISKAKKKKIPEDILNKIESYLKVPYYSKPLISKELNISLSDIERCINQLDNEEINSVELIRYKGGHYNNPSYQKPVLDFLAKNIRKFSKDEIKELFQLKSKLPSKSFTMKYFGGTYRRKPIVFHKGKTAPELIVEKILIENGIDFEYNKMISVIDNCNNELWYSVDFVINQNQIFVEVQGDYWHANPKIYSRNQLNGTQRNAVNRDRRKKAQIISKYQAPYFQIWENDIRNDTEIFKQQIKEIICIAQNKKV